MQSAAACPSCQQVVPFEADICPRCQAPLFSKPGAIRQLVRTRYDEAKKIFPQAALSLESLLEKVSGVLKKHCPRFFERNTGHSAHEIEFQFLNSLKWPELYLTTACAEGNEAAWQVFHSRYQSLIQKTARYYAENISEAKEISDSLMTDLFLPTPSDPPIKTCKIGQYDGTGSLEGWLKVVISRLAIDQIRKHQKQTSLEDLEGDLAVSASSASTAALTDVIDRQKASSLFAVSLRNALDQLIPQEKLVLNLYYLQNVNLKEIGKLLKVHESTVSRTVDRLTKQLRKSVEKHLRESFGVKRTETSQIIELAYAETEFNFKKILAK